MISILYFLSHLKVWLVLIFYFKDWRGSGSPVVSPTPSPASIPIEQGAEILQNESTVNKNGNSSAVLEFISKKTLAENFVFYKNGLISAGWEVLNAIDGQDQKIIEAQKGTRSARISIYKDANGKVVVSIQVAATIK